jgi:hypothetical protein
MRLRCRPPLVQSADRLHAQPGEGHLRRLPANARVESGRVVRTAVASDDPDRDLIATGASLATGYPWPAPWPQQPWLNEMRDDTVSLGSITVGNTFLYPLKEFR